MYSEILKVAELWNSFSKTHVKTTVKKKKRSINFITNNKGDLKKSAAMW